MPTLSRSYKRAGVAGLPARKKTQTLVYPARLGMLYPGSGSMARKARLDGENGWGVAAR